MTDATAEILAARAKLRERYAASGGSVKGRPAMKRRGAAGTSKNGSGPGAEERKVMQGIRKLGLNDFPPMEDVVMYKNDGTAMVFQKPRVQAALNANTFVITGGHETQPASQVKSYAPEIDPDTLRRIAEEWKKLQEKASAENMPNSDIPDLVENFENVD